MHSGRTAPFALADSQKLAVQGNTNGKSRKAGSNQLTVSGVGIEIRSVNIFGNDGFVARETGMTTMLYVATGRGVFRVTHGSRKANVHPLGLEDKGGVRWILADSDNAERLWVATERTGVLRTDDAGNSWQEKNEGLVYKHALSLARHGLTGTLYAGTEPACIFKSDDLGDSWTELESLRRLRSRKDWTFPGPPHVAHVRGIGLDANDPAMIFGAVEEGWLVRSNDGGQTWNNIIDGTEFDSHTVTILPDDSGVIVAASGKGLYRSDDRGQNFDRCDDGIDHPYLINVVVHPDRPTVLFTAGAGAPPPRWRDEGGPGAGFYKSDDAGLNWQQLTGGLPDRIAPAPRSIAVDPADPERIFVGLNDGEIWTSADSGASFSSFAAGLPPVLGISPVVAS